MVVVVDGAEVRAEPAGLVQVEWIDRGEISVAGSERSTGGKEAGAANSEANGKSAGGRRDWLMGGGGIHAVRSHSAGVGSA